MFEPHYCDTLRSNSERIQKILNEMSQPFDAAVDLFEKLRLPQLAQTIANISNDSKLGTDEIEVDTSVVRRDDEKRGDKLRASFVMSASEFAIHFARYVPQIKNQNSKKLLLSVLQKYEISKKKQSTLLSKIFDNEYLSISRSFLPFLKPVLSLVKFLLNLFLCLV